MFVFVFNDVVNEQGEACGYAKSRKTCNYFLSGGYGMCD